MVRKKVWVVLHEEGFVCPSCSGLDGKSAMNNAAKFLRSTPYWLKRKGYVVFEATLVVPGVTHKDFNP